MVQFFQPGTQVKDTDIFRVTQIMRTTGNIVQASYVFRRLLTVAVAVSIEIIANEITYECGGQGHQDQKGLVHRCINS